MKKFAILLLFLLLSLSCSKPSKIDGSVFVTAQGVSIKIGGVKVSAIPYLEAYRWINVDGLKLTTKQQFERMPEAVATTITDADGKFSLTIPKTGKYYVVTSANRAGLNYYWFYEIEAKGEEQKIILTDATLYKADIATE